MEPSEGRKRGRKRERVEGNAFMDVVRDAFVRYVALEKWREMQDMRETLGFDHARAASEAGQFPERGRYQPLWVRQWVAEVGPETSAADAGKLFAAIERAIAGALHEEEEARRSQGDRPLDEDPGYKAFVDAALERLLSERVGELGPG
jgi:hypothetical protein